MYLVLLCLLHVDTVYKQTNIVNRTETCQKSQLAGSRPVGYLQSAEELNSGPPNTDPSSGREEDLNQRHLDFKYNTLISRPHGLLHGVQTLVK